MISFKQFIAESSAYSPAPMTDTQFIEWCEINSPNYLKRLSTNTIFRGFDSPPLGYINTDKMQRTSANTFNYYTIWMDGDREWAAYPKRSKSLICSTDRGTANGFGDTQIIIPADKNKIGVCDSNDLWGSFEFLRTRLKNKDHYMDGFAEFTHILAKYFLDAGQPEAMQKSYDALVTGLKDITRDNIEEFYKKKGYDEPWGPSKHYVDAFEAYGYKNLFDLWRDVMDPDENSFDLQATASFKARPSKEVWVQGPCAVIGVDVVADAAAKPDHPLHAFVTKYNFSRIDL